jgi:replicative DNA helicase
MTRTTTTDNLPDAGPSEASVLGCVITRNAVLAQVREALTPADFADPGLRLIFGAMLDVDDDPDPARRAIDPITLEQHLTSRGELARAGGLDRLVGLTGGALRVENLPAYILKVKDTATRRALISHLSGIDARAHDPDVPADDLVRSAEQTIGALASPAALPVRALVDELRDLDGYLERFRGKDMIGIKQVAIPELDRMTLGLRGLILLAARPGVGKTALTVQLGIDAVANNPDVGFLFLSLEMPRQAMMTRILSRLSGLDWNKLVLGDKPAGGAEGVLYTPEQIDALQAARARMEAIGSRVTILDSQNCPRPTVRTIVREVQRMKRRTNCTRVVVLVDYLQVWPIPAEDERRVRSDLDADKYRVGMMKQLRDDLGDEDALLVISEARKPASGDTWGGDMSDVMGSARGTYTPDAVLLFSEATDDEIAEHHGLDRPVGADSNGKVKDWRKQVKGRRDELRDLGVNWCHLDVVKGRDGMTRGSIDLTFYYRRACFAPGFDVTVAKRRAPDGGSGTGRYRPRV